MGQLSGDRFDEVEVTSSTALWAWFAAHHDRADGIWLVTYKKHVTDKYVTHEDVLDALIAHGWCDGAARRVDDDRTMQMVSPRRTQPWARSYKDRAERLEADGRMHAAGRAAVDRAKASGDWSVWDDVDALVVPADLATALEQAPPAAENFASFPPSVKRSILRWIASAKTDATRSKRLSATAAEAALGRRVKSHG